MNCNLNQVLFRDIINFTILFTQAKYFPIVSQTFKKFPGNVATYHFGNICVKMYKSKNYLVEQAVVLKINA